MRAPDAPRGTPRRGPFIVVGMGRSGTSYVGSILQAASIEMGEDTKPADEHNEAGYFEDVEITRLHEAFLERRGLNLASISHEFPLAAERDEEEAIAAYVSRRGRRGPRWGVKAPGILFFWNTWQNVLPATAVVLIAFRHPSAVADSFQRYGLDRDVALALWLQLNSLALQAAAGPFTSVFLDYDDRQRFASSLRSALGTYVDTYRPALRHQHPRAERLEPALQEVYEELVAHSDKSHE